MNKFVGRFNDAPGKLKFRDTLAWEEDGKRYSEYMIYETPPGRIGLIGLYSAKLYEKDFSSFKELEKHFKEKNVDNNMIVITDSNEWVVYVP